MINRYGLREFWPLLQPHIWLMPWYWVSGQWPVSLAFHPYSWFTNCFYQTAFPCSSTWDKVQYDSLRGRLLCTNWSQCIQNIFGTASRIAAKCWLSKLSRVWGWTTVDNTFQMKKKKKKKLLTTSGKSLKVIASFYATHFQKCSPLCCNFSDKQEKKNRARRRLRHTRQSQSELLKPWYVHVLFTAS